MGNACAPAGSADVEHRLGELAALPSDQLPGALVVHRDPAALLLPVVPVLVELIEDLHALPLDHGEDLVVVVVLLVVVGDGLLPHLGVDAGEVDEPIVELGRQRGDVQAQPEGLPGGDGVRVRGIAGVELVADPLGEAGVAEVIGEDLLADFDREAAAPVDGADDQQVEGRYHSIPTGQ